MRSCPTALVCFDLRKSELVWHAFVCLHLTSDLLQYNNWVLAKVMLSHTHGWYGTSLRCASFFMCCFCLISCWLFEMPVSHCWTFLAHLETAVMNRLSFHSKKAERISAKDSHQGALSWSDFHFFCKATYRGTWKLWKSGCQSDFSAVFLQHKSQLHKSEEKHSTTAAATSAQVKKDASQISPLWFCKTNLKCRVEKNASTAVTTNAQVKKDSSTAAAA